MPLPASRGSLTYFKNFWLESFCTVSLQCYVSAVVTSVYLYTPTHQFHSSRSSQSPELSSPYYTAASPQAIKLYLIFFLLITTFPQSSTQHNIKSDSSPCFCHHVSSSSGSLTLLVRPSQSHWVHLDNAPSWRPSSHHTCRVPFAM